jgi:hypothetical protein
MGQLKPCTFGLRPLGPSTRRWTVSACAACYAGATRSCSGQPDPPSVRLQAFATSQKLLIERYALVASGGQLHASMPPGILRWNGALRPRKREVGLSM